MQSNEFLGNCPWQKNLPWPNLSGLVFKVNKEDWKVCKEIKLAKIRHYRVRKYNYGVQIHKLVAYYTMYICAESILEALTQK